ncbi:hypothetical protein DXG03_000704 [Asterophora parasitica]|uniref:Uncharacterized protein n=1 Tax=Asterophora parasitica TaxID=117018 RepID=A0A9P7GAK6_9AGAR|nr:hypothetical protein DXG03_000704 [Asterophora parasitica]
MLRCRELSKLPKVSRTKTINFRRQTPGSVTDLLKPAGVYHPPNHLDPTHPATCLQKNRFPSIRSDALGIRAFPHAVLSPPDPVWTTPTYAPFDTWQGRVEGLLSAYGETEPREADQLALEPMKLNNAKKNYIPMSFITATSKKRTHAHRCIRAKIVRRLKTSINLIVSRGADVVETNGKRKLVMNEQEAEMLSNNWICPGWTYIFFPTLEIYRMPYHVMIPMLRSALRELWIKSQAMEKSWEKRAINDAVGYAKRKQP